MAGRTFENVVARVYQNHGEQSSEEFRAVAVAGQGHVPTDQNIAFTRPLNAVHGSLVKIAFVTESSRKGQGQHLRAVPHRKGQKVDVITEAEAMRIVGTNHKLNSL